MINNVFAKKSVHIRLKNEMTNDDFTTQKEQKSNISN